MPYLGDLPEEASTFDLFAAYPEIHRPFAEFTEKLFRGEGSLPSSSAGSSSPRSGGSTNATLAMAGIRTRPTRSASRKACSTRSWTAPASPPTRRCSPGAAKRRRNAAMPRRSGKSRKRDRGASFHPEIPTYVKFDLDLAIGMDRPGAKASCAPSPRHSRF